MIVTSAQSAKSTVSLTKTLENQTVVGLVLTTQTLTLTWRGKIMRNIMNVVATGILFVLVLLCILTFLQNNFATIRHHSKNHGEVVRLVGPTGYTFCSGSVLSDNTLITAAHCIGSWQTTGFVVNNSVIEIRPASDISSGTSGTVSAYDTSTDIAWIKGDFKIYKKFRYLDSPQGLEELKQSEKFYTTCGFPLGGDLYCVDMTFVDQHEFSWLMIGVILPGMSGGPVFTSEGVQVAMNSRVILNHSLVTPIYNVHKGLE